MYRHRLSHGGIGQRRGHAHEGPAHCGLSRHLLQRWRGNSASAAAATRHAGAIHGCPPADARAHDWGTGRIVMSASQVNEESLESDQLGHGYFTYYLLQALKNGKGLTPLSQVYAAVAQQVSASVSAQGSHQHPVMSRSSADADFALRSAGAASELTPRSPDGDAGQQKSAGNEHPPQKPHSFADSVQRVSHLLLAAPAPRLPNAPRIDRPARAEPCRSAKPQN